MAQPNHLIQELEQEPSVSYFIQVLTDENWEHWKMVLEAVIKDIEEDFKRAVAQ
jgi:hypothetical protein